MKTTRWILPLALAVTSFLGCNSNSDSPQSGLTGTPPPQNPIAPPSLVPPSAAGPVMAAPPKKEASIPDSSNDEAAPNAATPLLESELPAIVVPISVDIPTIVAPIVSDPEGSGNVEAPLAEIPPTLAAADNSFSLQDLLTISNPELTASPGSTESSDSKPEVLESSNSTSPSPSPEAIDTITVSKPPTSEAPAEEPEPSSALTQAELPILSPNLEVADPKVEPSLSDSTERTLASETNLETASPVQNPNLPTEPLENERETDQKVNLTGNCRGNKSITIVLTLPQQSKAPEKFSTRCSNGSFSVKVSVKKKDLPHIQVRTED